MQQKKSLTIAETDLKRKNEARDKADSSLFEYAKQHNKTVDDAYRDARKANRDRPAGTEESRLVKEAIDAREAAESALNNVDAVQSYLRGLRGEPLREYDYMFGEDGRQYVRKLLNDEKYRDIFLDK